MARLRRHQFEAVLNAEALGPWLIKALAYLDADSLRAVVQTCQHFFNTFQTTETLPLFDQGLDLVEILSEIHMDPPGLIAAFILPASFSLRWDAELLTQHAGETVAALIDGVHRMDAVHHLRAHESDLTDYAHHLDNLRKMLVAMVADIRVVLIKLAHHIALLESAKSASAEQQHFLALESREVYAPLANRLGVGHLKWQLEDLSFRYLEPQAYAQIAKFVAEKRLDRQKVIDEAIQTLRDALAEDGISAEVTGRIKHIYSIARKMQRKNIQYEEVYDARAVRLIVDKIADCYAALGTVHRLWKHIPKEFDDYIASPKSNGYRSLHTAVVGPAGKVLEVQIRTQEMHEESELGVCAHWAYKAGVKPAVPDYNKMKWLRSLLEWQQEITNTQELFQDLKNSATEDRVYVFTPKGEVIDLPKGATPLDFAYHVHTSLGHRTRGAKVNGRIVPLTYVLESGEQIEILAQKEEKPGKDWLYSESGYLFTPRARAKVRAWFRQKNRDDNIEDGKHLIEKECARLDLGHYEADAVAKKLDFNDSDDMFAALGRGDLRVSQFIHAAYGALLDVVPPAEKIQVHAPAQQAPTDSITVEGVGNLMTTFAQCCSPVMGDDIVGYLAVGKGVSIHRKDCTNIHYSRSEHPEKIIEVAWGRSAARVYPVQIRIHSHDRKNLLRDITSVLSSEQVNVIFMDSKSNHSENSVVTHLTIEVPDLKILFRVLDRLQSVPNVIDCSRYHPSTR